jgi:hypothetical protein
VSGGREDITILKDNAAAKWLAAVMQNYRSLGADVIGADILAASQ